MIGTDHPIPWHEDPVTHIMNAPGFSDDERVHVSVARSHFNELAADGKLRHWREAYEHGHLKVEGDPNIQRLVGQVIARAEARTHLRRAR